MSSSRSILQPLDLNNTVKKSVKRSMPNTLNGEKGIQENIRNRGNDTEVHKQKKSFLTKIFVSKFQPEDANERPRRS